MFPQSEKYAKCSCTVSVSSHKQRTANKLVLGNMEGISIINNKGIK